MSTKKKSNKKEQKIKLLYKFGMNKFFPKFFMPPFEVEFSNKHSVLKKEFKSLRHCNDKDILKNEVALNLLQYIFILMEEVMIHKIILNCRNNRNDNSTYSSNLFEYVSLLLPERDYFLTTFENEINYLKQKDEEKDSPDSEPNKESDEKTNEDEEEEEEEEEEKEEEKEDESDPFTKMLKMVMKNPGLMTEGVKLMNNNPDILSTLLGGKNQAVNTENKKEEETKGKQMNILASSSLEIPD